MPSFVRPSLLATALIAYVAAPAADASSTEPFVFGTFNQAALARFAPLPTPQADSTGTGGRLTVDWTNEYVADQNAGETVVLDGETVRLALSGRVRHGHWLFGAEVPYLFTNGGTLDSTIETWHDWFNLPNGGRELEARNEYRYQYSKDGQALLDLGNGQNGLGDTRLFAARCGDGGGCIRAMLQLPTGDADHLMGGGLGGSLWYEQPYAFGGGWSGALAAGVSTVRADGPLEEQQKTFIPFGWASIGYALTQTLDAGAQFYAHGPLYDDSDLDALSKMGGQLAFGLRWRAAPEASVWLGVQEDIVTESSPDFSIHFATDFH